MKGRVWQGYGDPGSKLELTEKAFAFYSDTDPLDIIEYKYEGENEESLYSLKGCIETDKLTEQELIEKLEAWYDDIAMLDEED